MKQADNNKKNKHLTAQDRQEIMNGLDKRLSFKAIALLVQKDPTTISYEVKQHRKEHRNAFVQTDELCPLLDKAPFVCNACPKRRSANCRFLRLLYVAPQAHAEYEALLHDAREGIPLNRASFYKQDRIISSCIEKGPHIYYRRFSPRAQCISQHSLSAFFQGILFGFQDSPSTRRKVQASQKEAGGCRSFCRKEGTHLCGFPRSYGTGRA